MHLRSGLCVLFADKTEKRTTGVWVSFLGLWMMAIAVVLVFMCTETARYGALRYDIRRNTFAAILSALASASGIARTPRKLDTSHSSTSRTICLAHDQLLNMRQRLYNRRFFIARTGRHFAGLDVHFAGAGS